MSPYGYCMQPTSARTQNKHQRYRLWCKLNRRPAMRKSLAALASVKKLVLTLSL